ncbi:hypothetical protein ACJRO7_032925 [Eucalyptus globulus]|uniref:RING-type E3 ubiquitin transferase n=1 Tax=Eucalyptus globulus TaxID=34317 RepID=A0ABD3JMH1_EUCGL
MPPIPPPPPRPRRRPAAAALLLLLLLPTILPPVAAQPAPTPPSDESSPAPGYGAFSNSIGLVLVALVIVIFLLATFSAYILRYSPAPEGSIGRAVRSLRRLGAPPRGLDPAVVETFPTVAYAAVKGHRIGERSLECAVCLNDFEDDDTLRLIPKCDHAFHPDCIGEWLASHTTCPVCRADLASQPADDPESPQAEPPSVEPPAVEAAPPDGGAPERSPREGGPERIQPPDPWDKNESGGINNRNRTRGSGSRIRRFPRSHSTGHSLVRPDDDTERFTLRLPAYVRKRLMMDRPGPALPQEGCSRRGYRYGEGSSRGRYYRRLDRLDSAPGSEGQAFNRMPSFLVRMSSALSPRVAAAAAARSGRWSFRGPAQQARPPI